MEQVNTLNFQEAVTYIQLKKILGSRPGLASIYALLERMNHPEKQLRCIHLAGTNGKGSIGNYLSHILQCAGYRVGFFSSPAVYDLCEMIRFNNQNITENDFAESVCVVKTAADAMEREGLLPPTEFELLTATAFHYFLKKSCDYVVVECGMGGRLDATNVLENTAASVLCRIDFDHTNFLGKTLTEISKEKCGIMRQNTPVVVYPVQEDEVIKTIQSEAEKQFSTVYQPMPERVHIIACDASGSCFSYGPFLEMKIKMQGKHQVYNAVTALEVICRLKAQGANISNDAVGTGLLEASWAGRFERLLDHPPVILDGAHNVNGVKAFTEAIKNNYPHQTFIGVVGMLCDKELSPCLQLFAHVCRVLVLTEVVSERTATVEALKKAAEELSIPVVTVKNPAEAIKYAFAIKSDSDGVFCAGSLYNLAIFKRAFYEL